MTNEKIRLYRLDGDSVQVKFLLDEESGRYFGDYPDFAETPRHTPSGFPWVNVTMEGCPFAEEDYGDCGSCSFFRPEKKGDLIGICTNKQLCIVGSVKNPTSERKNGYEKNI